MGLWEERENCHGVEERRRVVFEKGQQLQAIKKEERGLRTDFA